MNQLLFRRTFRSLALGGLLPAALLLSGCMQVETHIKFLEDGSATVTERLRLSRRLLELAEAAGDPLPAILAKEAALKRLAGMGEGATLVSHEQRDAEGSAKESFAVYKIADINKLKYVSPWLDILDYHENNEVRFKVVPLYVCGSSGGQVWAGQIRIEVKHPKPVKQKNYSTDPKKNPNPPKEPSPVEQQIYRELAPVFRDLLKDFQARLTFESYCPLIPSSGSPPIRDLSSGTTTVDLLNFTSKDLDSFGGKFLENEEIMLEMVKLEFGGNNIVNDLKSYASNKTLPVFMARNWGGTSIYVAPSKILFDKYFEGKMLDYQVWTHQPPALANFNKIGWRPRTSEPEKK